MQKQITRGHSKRQIDDAKVFAEAMNSDGVVVDMFRPMVELTMTLTRRLHSTTDENRRRIILLRYRDRINEIKQRIAKKYPAWKKLDHFSDEGAPAFVETALLRGSVEYQIEEAEAALLLDIYHRLSESGMIGKLRRCDCRLPSGDSCRNFFFVHRKTKTMSCSACYRRSYNQLPDVKKENAKYQRKYYHDWLSVDAVKKHRGKKPRRVRGR